MNTVIFLTIIIIVAIIGNIVYKAVEYRKELKRKKMEEEILKAKYEEIKKEKD